MARFSIQGLGQAIFGSGSRVHISRTGGVTVDGDMIGGVGGTVERPTVVEVRVLEGSLRELRSDMGVVVAPEVTGITSVSAGMGVQCGPVGGDVDAGMEVRCGSVRGSVTAGMGVKCDTVGGSVDAGMGVKMRK